MIRQVQTWVKILTNSVERDNYVLVKSKADFPAASGNTITLDENTLYEINGTINLGPDSIDLNKAYVAGRDANEDILKSSGTVFEGSTGGSIKILLFRRRKAFKLLEGTPTSHYWCKIQS